MLKKIFDNMSTGVVILDKGAQVKFINKYMDDFIKPENRSAIQMGELFGNMFTCVYTEEEDKKCGYTEHCPECPVRNSLGDVTVDSQIVVFEKEFYLPENGMKGFFGVSMKPMSNEKDTDILLELFHIKDQRIENITQNFEEIKEKMKSYKEKSYRDILTGLYNRNFYDEKIEKIFFTENYQEKKFSLIILDLDNLKMINDTKGHQEGDKAIQELGKIIRNATSKLKESYSLRIGGDEFMIFLYLNQNESLEIAQEILKEANMSKRNISVSMGLVERKTEEKLKSLYRKADEALYSAKKNGKGTVVIGK